MSNSKPVYVGQTIRTLPLSLTESIQSLRSVSFNVPHNYATIKVTATQGEWKVTLVQFISDGTSVGSWIQDGPHTLLNSDYTFNLAALSLTPTGNIRLICSNVTSIGTGNTFAEYFLPEPNTGTISIESN